MVCSKCGSENIEASKFCIKCGNSIRNETKISSVSESRTLTTKNCSGCGKRIYEEISACPYCGKRQQNSRPTTTSTGDDIKSPVLKIIGGGLFVLGVVLIIGNLTGIFRTFPFAGFITMTIGGAIYSKTWGMANKIVAGIFAVSIVLVISGSIIMGYQKSSKEADIRRYGEQITEAIKGEKEGMSKLQTLAQNASNMDDLVFADKLDSEIIPLLIKVTDNIKAIHPPDNSELKSLHYESISLLTMRTDALSKLSQGAKQHDEYTINNASSEFQMASEKIEQFGEKFKSFAERNSVK